jgi:hypothetical protein
MPVFIRGGKLSFLPGFWGGFTIKRFSGFLRVGFREDSACLETLVRKRITFDETKDFIGVPRTYWNGPTVQRINGERKWFLLKTPCQ